VTAGSPKKQQPGYTIAQCRIPQQESGGLIAHLRYLSFEIALFNDAVNCSDYSVSDTGINEYGVLENFSQENLSSATLSIRKSPMTGLGLNPDFGGNRPAMAWPSMFDLYAVLKSRHNSAFILLYSREKIGFPEIMRPPLYSHLYTWPENCRDIQRGERNVLHYDYLNTLQLLRQVIRFVYKIQAAHLLILKTAKGQRSLITSSCRGVR
jgi:hypothetical protein